MTRSGDRMLGLQGALFELLCATSIINGYGPMPRRRLYALNRPAGNGLTFPASGDGCDLRHGGREAPDAAFRVPEGTSYGPPCPCAVGKS